MFSRLTQCLAGVSIAIATAATQASGDTPVKKVIAEPLIRSAYTADPSAHAFEGRLYIYPSHDWDSHVEVTDDGSHFDMKDYHVYSTAKVGEPFVDHGKVLDIADVPWATRQLWAPDAAEKDGKYYLYFPAKDKDDIFRIGVATSDSPAGPFTAEPTPMKGSYSIDPTVFKDDDGTYYMYVGGIWGGQLQRWDNGQYLPTDTYPEPNEPALRPLIARLSADMLNLDEELKSIYIFDKKGKQITVADNERRFFEAAWMHKYGDRYYLSWSTGDTHNIVYAIGGSPYGPFIYQGVILEEVLGWTNHHSIAEFENKWYLFFHDSSMSGGETHLRSVKMTELTYNKRGMIHRMNAMVEKKPNQ